MTSLADVTEAETPKDFGPGEAGEVKRWLRAIEQRMHEMKRYHEEAREIIERFRMDREKSMRDQFNILYSNTETLMGAVYQQPPTPVVRRRFRDADPIGRETAEVLERALESSIDQHDWHGHMKRAVFDYITVAHGLVRVEYVPYFESRRDRITLGEFDDPEAEDVQTDEMGQFYREGEEYETLVNEEVWTTYVRWDRWCADSAPIWEDKTWLAYEHQMERTRLVEEFGPQIGNLIELDWAPKDSENWDEEKKQQFKRATVYELWDREARKRRWIAKSLRDRFARVDDDPLNLEGFFDCAPPMCWSGTNESDEPIPNYRQYRALARQLNMLEERKTKLAKELKWRGVILKDANEEAMMSLAKAGDNEFIALQDAVTYQEKGGLANYFMALDIKPLVEAMIAIQQQIADVKNEIFEITGLSDIIRGSTKATETATAQDLKARFGSQRIDPKRDEVERMARDIFRLKSEIIAEMFGEDTLAAMTGKEVTPEMMQLLRDERLRGFRVDIETRSTMADDEESERQDRIEMLQAVIEGIERLAPLVQSGMLPLDTAKSMIMFGVRGFKASREIEDALDQIGMQPQSPQDEAAQAAAVDPALMDAMAGLQQPNLQVIQGGLNA